jgi:hypothetical protein
LAPSDEFCIQNGIISQTITLYSYQQNNITECKDQTLKKVMNSMLVSLGAPQEL